MSIKLDEWPRKTENYDTRQHPRQHQEMLNGQKHSSMAEDSCDEWRYPGTISAYSPPVSIEHLVGSERSRCSLDWLVLHKHAITIETLTINKKNSVNIDDKFIHLLMIALEKTIKDILNLNPVVKRKNNYFALLFIGMISSGTKILKKKSTPVRYNVYSMIACLICCEIDNCKLMERNLKMIFLSGKPVYLKAHVECCY